MKKRSSPNLEHKKRETWNHRHSIGTSNKSSRLRTAYLVLPQSPAKLSATLRNIQNVFITCAPSCKIKHWPTQAEHEPAKTTDFVTSLQHCVPNQSEQNYTEVPSTHTNTKTPTITIVWQITIVTSRKWGTDWVAFLSPADKCSSCIMLSKNQWCPFKSNHVS